MRSTALRHGTLLVVAILVTVVPATSISAQDLAILRAESLNEVISGFEEISRATGQEISREMVLGMAAGFTGKDPAEYLDLDRPIAIAMPVQGMMLQENGVVAAVPVTDAAAAIEVLANQFPNHTVDGELHSFTNESGPSLYLIATNDYVRVGGDADLVVSTDPLAAEATGADLSLEIFLEPVAPMIEANLDSAKGMLESAVSMQEDVSYDPETMGTMFDFYLDGIRYILANTSRLRITLDVDDGFVQFTKALVPIPDSSLAAFIAAQKGGLPKIAKLANSDSAWYMAGRVTFGDEHKQGVKALVDVYMDLMASVLESTGVADFDASAGEETQPQTSAFWADYMSVMEQFSDRWVDCLRGDMVASIDLPEEGSFQFTEAFGINGGDACKQLVPEMGEEFARAVAESETLSEVYTVEEGPRIGDSKSVVMTFDMMKMVEEMGTSVDQQGKKMMEAFYGETMTGAISTVGDIVIAAGGENATDLLRGLVVASKGPGKAPSFAPLETGPGLMMGINLGEILTWAKRAVPEDAEAIERAAAALSGDAGRIPMAIKFDNQIASFEMAVSLKTIETINTAIEEEKAKAAAEEPEPEVYDEAGETSP